MDKKNWMTIEEAGEYLGLGKTVIYQLTRDGKIPANKVAQKWLYNKDNLDAWVASSRPIEAFFKSVDFNIDENLQLREPQIEAYKAVHDSFKAGNRKAIVQIPVGCGKTGLAALLPFDIAEGRVLVIAPNLTIKKVLMESFDVTNRQKCFWRKRGVLSDEVMIGGPFACTLDIGNLSICEKSHFVITNVQQLATNADKWLNKFPDNFFDLIIVDEAHHSAANSWQLVMERFPNAKVVHLTATPFRSDKQEIEGERVYRYPFKKATFNGYVKKIKSWYAAPSELTFTAKGETKTYSLEEVLKMKEKDWFSRGIALSEVCNRTIVDNSLEKLEEARQTGTHHQLIAVACSVDHGRAIRSMYEERGYKADVIYSELDQDKQDEIMRRLKNGDLDCIVQVQMLGEGFDHPKLTVAAIFRPFRSLAPYIQFVGRILRVIVQNDPTHPDNYGHIVTHAGMNLDQRLQEFKFFEKDDQQFWDEVIEGKDPEPPREVKAGEARLRTSEPALANHEIVESLIEEDFVTADDEDVIRDLEQKLELLGLDPSQARNIVLNRAEKNKLVKAAEPTPVQPQKEWEQLRKRLKEKVDRNSMILLNRLEIKRQGRELLKAGVNANNNFVAGITLINMELNKKYQKGRNEWTTEEFKKATASLDDIVNGLTRTFKVKLKND
jgi:DNA repair protein RadD